MSVGVDESTGEIVQTMSLASMRASSLQMRAQSNQSDDVDSSSSDEEKGGSAGVRRHSAPAVDRSRNISGVSGLIDEKARALKVVDFMAVDKYIFPLSIGGMNSNFKFKDYAPLAFRNLRNFWGVENIEYLLSVCPPEQGFINFISNSKSGQYFFFSHDMKYMIKTLSDDECKFLRRILPHYVRHMTQNPNSLINRYYGLHRVKMPHIRRKLHFVVMNNIFETPKAIHTKYDLKGATYKGRYTPLTKIQAKLSGDSIRKDLNFMGFTEDDDKRVYTAPRGARRKKGQPEPQSRQWLNIGDPKRKLELAMQVGRDAVFLAEMRIMDYSLLVGVHGREPVRVPGYSLGKPMDEYDEDYDDYEYSDGEYDDEDGEYDDEDGEYDDAAAPSVDLGASADFSDVVGSPDSRRSASPAPSSPRAGVSGVGSPGGGSSTGSKSRRKKAGGRTRSGTKRGGSGGIRRSARQGSGASVGSVASSTGGSEDGGEQKSVAAAPPPLSDEPLRQNTESGVWEDSDIPRALMQQPPTRVSAASFNDKLMAAAAETKTGEGGGAPAFEERVPLSIFQRDDGGFWGQNPDGTPNNEIYYLGIIDILQQYNVRKWGENKFKSWFTSQGAKKISALPPRQYAKRFIEFISASIR